MLSTGNSFIYGRHYRRVRLLFWDHLRSALYSLFATYLLCALQGVRRTPVNENGVENSILMHSKCVRRVDISSY